MRNCTMSMWTMYHYIQVTYISTAIFPSDKCGAHRIIASAGLMALTWTVGQIKLLLSEFASPIFALSPKNLKVKAEY